MAFGPRQFEGPAPLRRPRSASLPRVRLLVIAAVLMIAASGPVPGQKMPSIAPVKGSRVGNLAHNFALKDLDGHEYRLEELLGKRVIHITFWATWCMPCIAEIPRLREMYARYHDRGLEVFGVIVPISQTRDGVLAFSKQHEINYPVLWDDDEAITGRYRVSSVPKNFLIGRDGIIRHASVELPHDLDALIEKLLKEEAPAKH